VRTRYLDYAGVQFVFDTGADLTSLPILMAQRHGIDFNQADAVRGVARGLVGAVERFRARIHVRVGTEEFDWPCDFLAEPVPIAGQPPVPASRRAYGVLGRAGVLAVFKICVDDSFLTITLRLTDRPWWYRLAHALVPRRAIERLPDVPL
jgi:hypothetical protein